VLKGSIMINEPYVLDSPSFQLFLCLINVLEERRRRRRRGRERKEEEEKEGRKKRKKGFNRKLARRIVLRIKIKRKGLVNKGPLKDPLVAGEDTGEGVEGAVVGPEGHVQLVPTVFPPFFPFSFP